MAGMTNIPERDALGVNIEFDDDIDTTVSKDVDGRPTWLLGGVAVNNDVDDKIYYHLFDLGTPVLGTDPTELQFPVAASGTQELICPLGLFFSVGASYASAKEAGDSASTAPDTAGDMYLVTTAGRSFSAEVGDQRLERTDVASRTISVAVKSALGTERAARDSLQADAITFSSGAETLYVVKIDNRNNPNAKSYVKIYNNASPTVGTTDPEMIFFAPKGKRAWYVFPRGLTLSTALSAAAVTTGGTGGTTAPSNKTTVELYF
jgi:hypothetical protein